MTRVLYIDHPEADFLSAIVFGGLCQLLGPENVVDYPYKRSYHNDVHTYPSVYGHGTGVTAPFAWFEGWPGREWSRDQVLAAISDHAFDLAVLASPRPYGIAALTDIVGALGRNALPPLVIMDGEDHTDIRHDLVQQFSPRVYFKRELLPNSGTPCRLDAMPFGSPVRRELLDLPAPEKTIDVLFMCGATSGVRAAVCDVLARHFGSRFTGGIVPHSSHEAYLHTIAKAKVAISARGFGFDTLRYWEIPSMADTLMIADKIPIVKPDPFEHGQHVLYFDDFDHLIRIVEHALDHETWRLHTARQGNAHLRAHHTAAHRAHRLLSIGLGW